MMSLRKFVAVVSLVGALVTGVAAFDAAPSQAATYDTDDVTDVTNQLLTQTNGGYVVLDGIYEGRRGRWVTFFLSGNMYFLD